MTTLYEHPLSPYAQKVKIALLEKGVKFDLQMPNLLGGDDEFARVSPRREVPTLLDGDDTIFDSTIILEYIEDRWPKPPLLPAEPAARARVRMIEEMCDTYYEAINWAAFEVQIFKRATGALAEQLLARGAKQRAGVNAWLERQLGEHPWFDGKQFGWGDLSAIPVVAAGGVIGDPPSGRLGAWLARASERPSVKETLDEATAVMPSFDQVGQLVSSGMFKREYRDHRLEWMMRSGGTQIVLDGLKNGNIRFSTELE
jgi:glutathione S-transferase/RNA polymerase-associated protein